MVRCQACLILFKCNSSDLPLWLEVIFCNILAMWTSSGSFCQGCEGNKPHWTVRCWARLILSGYSSTGFTLWFEAPSQNPPGFSWSSRFFQSKQNFLNLLVKVLWSSATSPFAEYVFDSFCSITVQFEIVKYKFPNQTRLHVYLCGFQITQRMKQCTTCQHTKYHHYQHQQVPFTVWTTLVTWYTHCKFEWTKILQNFWLTLVYKYVYIKWTVH